MSQIKSTKLVNALQEQLNFERFSADIYDGLAGQLDTLNLTGMSAYLAKRAGEERGHAHKFASFLADRGHTPALSALPDPMIPAGADPMGAGARAFSAALAHEVKVTERINALYTLAFDEDDPATEDFLRWFVTEQVEEEKTLEEILTKFKLAAGNGAAVLLIDHELGA
jgi:ferritin